MNPDHANREPSSISKPESHPGGSDPTSPPNHSDLTPHPHSSPPVPPHTEDITTRAIDDALRSGTRLLRFVMLLVTGAVLLSGIFTVQPNEIAVVLRFGKPVSSNSGPLRQPGLHWALPYPLDEIVRMPVGQSHSVSSTAGWYLITPEQEAAGTEPDARTSLIPGTDGYLLTADGNIIHARATVKYRITDPLSHAFRFSGVSNLLQNVLNNALADAAGRFRADAAVYSDKTGFRDAVLDRIREAVEAHRLGITLEPSDVQVVAPLEVRPAFESVLAAEQERSSKINEARAYAAEVTVKAIGESEAVQALARGRRSQLVATVAAEADAFNQQLPHFQRDPQLFTRRRLTETLERVLTNAQDKFFFPARSGNETRHLRLQLSREPTRPGIRDNPRP